jgi:hypothetical protein
MKNKSLRSGLLGLLATGAMVIGTSVLAVDNETKVSSDTTKNPITGTVTHTKEYKHKRKHADGKTSEEDVKQKTSVKSDGTVEKSTDTETSPPADASK